MNESATESRFDLIFAPTATTFAPIAGDPTQPSIGFALASRTFHAVQPRGLKGLVRGMSFDQADTVLIIHFATATASTVFVVQSYPRTVMLTV